MTLSDVLGTLLDGRAETSRPIRNIDTALLRTFVRVADAKSLAAAGLEMDRTQAAVSQRLTRLEQLVGQPLLARNGRRLAPTPLGIRFLDLAKRTLTVHDALDFGEPFTSTSIGQPPSSAINPQDLPDSSGALVVRVRRKSLLPDDVDSIEPSRSFESNLVNGRLMDILSFWRSARGAASSFDLNHLIANGLISRAADNCLLFEIRDRDVACIDATSYEARDLMLDKYGFGALDHQLIDDPGVLRARRNMYMTCNNAEVPVFYTGNAVMPSNSPVLRENPNYSRVALDRLLLPVTLGQSAGSSKPRRGIVIIGAWDPRRFYTCLAAPGDTDPWIATVPSITERVIFGF